MLANLLCQTWLLLVILNGFMETHRDIYFTKNDSGLLHYFGTEKIRQYVLANLLCLILVFFGHLKVV